MMFSRTKALALGAALALGVAALPAVPAEANTLRWASQGDALTLDPHAQNEGPTNAMSQQIYDPLIRSADDLSLEPGLALTWEPISETTWELTLRQGVTFHGGEPFTAEDAVFSLDRARTPPSDYRNYLSSVTSVEAVDDYTIHIHTDGPNPILPNQLIYVVIMSKSWSEEHGLELAQDYASGEENHAVRNANGTGPYIVETREPDIRTVLVRNDDYWGIGTYPMEAERVVYTPIQSAATRIAALLSGELDFVLDPPVQDLDRLAQDANISLQKAPENRTIFLGVNVTEDGKPDILVDGENPFANPLVRQAINQSIDINTIQRVVMRGQSEPAGSIAPTFITGYQPEFDDRPAFDQDAARALLAEAGYPDGFRTTLSCPNDRYINDEGICQAVVGMLGQIGIQADLRSQTRSLHFQELQNREQGFYMLGWGVPTLDSEYIFNFLYHTDDGNRGTWNATGFSNARMDELTAAMTSEIDLERRNEMIAEAWDIALDALIYIPLHHQVLNWATRAGVNVPIRSDNSPRFMSASFD